jgi:chemotaxis protein histidine kinase CheA
MMETKSMELSVGAQVWFEEQEEKIIGTIVYADDGMVTVRKWEEQEELWHPTETMYDVLASSITINEFLSDSVSEEPDEDDDEEGDSTLPYCEEEKIISNIGTLDIKDINMTEQDFEILVKSIAKLVIAEVGVKIDPPAGFSNKPAATEDDAADDAVVEETSAEEAPAEEAAPEEAPAAAEEAPAEEAPAEEAPAEEAPAEEAPADSVEEAAAPAEEPVAEVKELGLTLQDLKEFSDLVKML